MKQRGGMQKRNLPFVCPGCGRFLNGRYWPKDPCPQCQEAYDYSMQSFMVGGCVWIALVASIAMISAIVKQWF
jgi:hypothetical protein